MTLIINPGSGPVDGATEENAWTNMAHLCADLRAAGIEDDLRVFRMTWRDDGDGRFSYLVWAEDKWHCHEVQMPGLPLAQVRYMDRETQNIWDFPRLYVDGSSWVWEFALGVMPFGCENS